MKMIVTKYLPATEHRGPRIVATDMDGNRVTIAYPDEGEVNQRHRKAAIALCRHMMWTGALVEGWHGEGSYAYCWAEPRNTFCIPPFDDPYVSVDRDNATLAEIKRAFRAGKVTSA